MACHQAPAYGCFFCGLLREASLQFDILSSRFLHIKTRIDDESKKFVLNTRSEISTKLLRKYIVHHENIYR